LSRRTRIGLLVTILVIGDTLLADVLHLKDGRSIPVESWEYKGDNVIFDIKGGSVTIPKSLLERVEVTSPPAAKAATPPQSSTAPPPGKPTGASRPVPRPAPKTPAATATPPADWSRLPEDAKERELDKMKRALRDQPQQREELSRQLALGFSDLAAQSANRGDLAAAQTRFGEALSYDPHCLPAVIGLSSVYLKQGKDSYARAQIEEGLVFFPKDPTLHFLLGEVHYVQENLRDAISQWETSLSLASDPRVAARLEKARREFAVDESYQRKDTAHFTFRYAESGSISEGLAASLRDFLEEEYGELSGRFQFVPPAPLVVILYPSRDFHQVTQEPATVAGLFDGKIRIPLGGVRTLNPPLRAVLVHELTHAFVYGKSGGNCPRWLQEGLAQLQEGKSLSPAEERSLVRDLAASEGRSWYDEFSYASSLSFTRYLSEKYPFQVFLETLDRMKAGGSAEEALRESTLEDFAQLQKGWVDQLVLQFAEGH
jgi:tetratricopeptide (TPR) repeat protein